MVYPDQVCQNVVWISLISTVSDAGLSANLIPERGLKLGLTTAVAKELVAFRELNPRKGTETL